MTTGPTTSISSSSGYLSIKGKKLLPSELVQMYRHRAGLTQIHFAALAGLNSKRMVQYWETGTSLPKPETLKKLLESLLRKGIFLHGQERDEVVQFWQAVKGAFDSRLETLNPYPVLDERWLEEIISLKHNSELEPVSNLASHLEIKTSIPPLPEAQVQRNVERLNNLPSPLTSFVGREREINELKSLLGSTRLLTLTGAGGVGKTRLALTLAGQYQERFNDGVWLVELAALIDPQLLAQVVAQALGLGKEGSGLVELDLLEYLRSKQLLVVLDNCEHLIEGCAILVAKLLQHCAGLQILATSREGLNIPGEVSYRVPSLALSVEADLDHSYDVQMLLQNEAVHLFVDRATEARPEFRLNVKNAPGIIRICNQLDGIPLAIELAAGRVKVLSVEQINSRLDDRFRLLTGGSRVALPRQQTLRATIEWSYELLSEVEQRLFRRLAVLTGIWSLEEAETIGTGEGIETSGVFDLVAQLVNKSLVVVLEAGEHQAQTAYYLLETLRQYGQEKLAEKGELEPWEKLINYLDREGDNARISFNYIQARRCYSEELAALSHLPTTPDNQRRWVDTAVRLTIGNLGSGEPHYLLALMQQAETLQLGLLETKPSQVDQYRLKLVYFRLGICYQLTGDYLQANNYYKLALERAGEPDEQTIREIAKLGISNLLVNQNKEVLPAYITKMIGYLLLFQGYYNKALLVLEQACDMLKQIGEDNLGSAALCDLGVALAATGQYLKGIELGEQALQQALRIGDANIIFGVYLSLSKIHFHGLNPEKVLEFTNKAMEKVKIMDGVTTRLNVLTMQAIAESMLGRHEVAFKRIAQANKICEKIGGKALFTEFLRVAQATVALQAGKYDEALHYAGVALELAKRVGNIGFVGYAEQTWGQALIAIGGNTHLAEAASHLRSALEAFEESGAVVSAAQVHVAWGNVCDKSGDKAGAQEHYRQAIIKFENGGLNEEVNKIRLSHKALPGSV